LFEIDIPPLEQQRRNREFELLVQTCIMNTIRDKIPVETLLRQFIDETQEIEVTRVEKTLNTTAKSLEPPIDNSVSNMNVSNTNMNNTNFQKENENILEPMQPNPIVRSNFTNMNQSINQSMNQPMNQSMNKFTNENFDESRKSTIKFNSEPSILEIENSDSLDEIKLGDPTSISFEDLDSDTPLNLEFEEL
jgi:hypothetical protein